MDLLCIAPSTYNDPFAEEWHPDLRYTVSFLRRAGREIGFLSIPAIGDSQLLIDYCSNHHPKAVYIELTEENSGPALQLLDLFRCQFPGIPTLVGGIPATLSPDEVLSHNAVDYVVAGERELSLLETIEKLVGNQALTDVMGIISRDFRNEWRPLLADLDDLGKMIHDGLAEILVKRTEEARVAYLVSSRGCYGTCTFCGIPPFYRQSAGRPWRGRSANAVVNEMSELMKAFQVRKFFFQDDDFIGPGLSGQQRAQKIATEIMKRELNIEFYFCCRLNDVRVETLKLLKAAGLRGIGVSVESVNQESLELLGKRLKSDNIYPTLNLLEGLQIPCEVNLIFLDPYITLSGVRKNLELIQYLRQSEYLSYSDAFPYNELVPFPWSPSRQRLKAEGLFDEVSGVCLFRNPKVGELAHFIRRLRQHLPVTFKSRLLFNDLYSRPAVEMDESKIDAIRSIAAGLRHWIGLALLPQYITSACDILESNTNHTNSKLAELELSFQGQLTSLYELERCFSAN